MALFGKRDFLRPHVNYVPGTHNYERDNRQAFYRMLGDHFFAGKADYRAEEIPCDGEVKGRKELEVPLPDFRRRPPPARARSRTRRT